MILSGIEENAHNELFKFNKFKHTELLSLHHLPQLSICSRVVSTDHQLPYFFGAHKDNNYYNN